MITSISISDFQAHKQLVVDLSPTVTVILGPSDVGKSAVLRALRWVATNKPAGDAFIRDGARKASVQVEVDGHKVGRVRGRGGTNEYTHNASPLKAFGSDPPAPVVELLNVSSINFQGQHDGPYWFGETAGTVSRELNAIINLSAIDRVLSNLNGWIRQADAKLGVCEERLRASLRERRDLKPAKVMDEALQAAEQQFQGMALLATAATTLRSLLTEVRGHGERCKYLSALQTGGGNAVLVGAGMRDLRVKASKLSRLVREARGLSKKCRPLPVQPEQVRSLRKRMAECEVLRKCIASLRKEQQVEDSATERIEKLVEERKAKYGRVCPTCGRKLT